MLTETVPTTEGRHRKKIGFKDVLKRLHISDSYVSRHAKHEKRGRIEPLVREQKKEEKKEPEVHKNPLKSRKVRKAAAYAGLLSLVGLTAGGISGAADNEPPQGATSAYSSDERPGQVKKTDDKAKEHGALEYRSKEFRSNQPRKPLEGKPKKSEVKEEQKHKNKEHRYVVKKGDTLWDISKDKYKDPMKWKDLASVNHLKNPDLIYPDQDLKLLPEKKAPVKTKVNESKHYKKDHKKKDEAVTYKVKEGDTLSGIADKHDSTVREIAKLNGIKNVHLIFEDQNLKISGEERPQVKHKVEKKEAKDGRKIVYMVRSGDTLSEIARKYDTTVPALLKRNPGIEDHDLIHPRDKIRLVRGEKIKAQLEHSQKGASRYEFRGDLSPEAVKAYGKKLTLERYGEDAWPAVNFIITNESAWKYDNYNKQETWLPLHKRACGLPQAKPCTKLTKEIGSFENIDGQMDWFFDYVDGVYGGPMGAYYFWLRNRAY